MTQPRTDGPQLIAYLDRCGGSVRALHDLLEGPLTGAFAGVHLLPYFTPYDGVDAGFDPQDHTAVDPRLGTWDDVRSLSDHHTVMSDVIVNHVSAESPQFQDVVRRGDQSPWAPMFLTLDAVFPGGATESDLTRIYRPRPGLPFTPIEWAGKRRLVWTTFTPEQIDIDLRTPQAWEYLESVVDALTSGGVTMLRLDAVGYTGKETGTDCFMTPSTSAYTQRIVAMAHERGAKVLLEVHGHHSQQIEIAKSVDLVYDFALPPLVLHALHARDLEPLKQWFAIRPKNAVTVLDTHDGIGIVDVGESDLAPGQPGLLEPRQIDALVDSIHHASHGTSLAATGAAASNLDLYQVNCTFYDALGRDDDRYLLARLIQLMTPGIPQVYYVGLFAGTGDMELLKRTGVGRDVNRHHFSAEQIESALERPIVAAQLDAMKLRNTHPAFDGYFSFETAGTAGVMRWTKDDASVVLTFDVADASFDLKVSDD
ncbi:sucrose phosphorylase [Demequina sp. TTPB684]|uniref:sucrose phosphorylase n=1 Tax=unclassified Demequina TaxID=2620311 RepID=UPI001CF29FBE|nr:MULTISPECIES: sucrose phosphorylase [unclassified Demequina]MCB2412916.1 sucrose phosphorylase [Demequina sp. TTPB684]UPU87859.1 sucrose phosphorylase [Demequina sp. TMPB413]